MLCYQLSLVRRLLRPEDLGDEDDERCDFTNASGMIDCELKKFVVSTSYYL
jgi:hypothetical protein